MKLLADRCHHVKDDGNQCRATKLRGSKYCFFHDPAKAGERAAAQQAGGRNGRAAVLPPDAPHRRVKTAAEVIDLLSETINQVRTGQLDPKVGNCVGYLSSVILRAIEQGDMAERLAALESIVSRQAQPSSLFDADADDLVIEDDDIPEPRRASA